MTSQATNDLLQPILTVDSVGKTYARKTVDVRRKLGGAAWRAIFHVPPSKLTKLKGSQFWAVQSITFELMRGRALGIIGLNGSGKTTLLRILAGQIPPDTGEIQLRGSSAAMIDLQAGFQSQASGYENIFLRSAALGFTRQETQKHLAQIVAFSELGDALSAPMATYSSGMRMRLAFSVMAIVSPDILFIDEVLAVGDFRFRQKCLARIRQMRERSAFVFVSHSMSDIMSFCDEVIVMHKGLMHFKGEPEQAIEVYESLDTNATTIEPDQKLKTAMGPVFENESAISNVEHFWCDAKGDRIDQTRFGEPFALHIKFKSKLDIRKLIIGVPVWAINA